MECPGENSDESSGSFRLSENAFLEKEFQFKYLSDSLESIRVGLVLLLVLYLLAGLKDATGTSGISEYIPLLGITLPIVLIILLSIGFTEVFIRYYFFIISFVLILECMGIPHFFFKHYKQYSGDESFPLVAIMILMFWVYGFSRLGLMRSSQWACLITTIYIVSMMSINQADQANLLIDIIILIIVNITGMTYCYENERYARLLFYEKLSINKLF